jgi:hypothetical protein
MIVRILVRREGEQESQAVVNVIQSGLPVPPKRLEKEQQNRQKYSVLQRSLLIL